MHEFDYLPILLVYETYIPIKRKDSREISVRSQNYVNQKENYAKLLYKCDTMPKKRNVNIHLAIITK